MSQKSILLKAEELLAQEATDNDDFFMVLCQQALGAEVATGDKAVNMLLWLSKTLYLDEPDKEKRAKAREQRMQAVRYLITNSDVAIDDKEEDSGYTALHYLSEGGFYDAIALLLKASEGINLELKERLGHTPLHLAVNYGEFEICKLLIDLGADINTQNNSGETCLHSLLVNVSDLHQDNYLRIFRYLFEKNSSGENKLKIDLDLRDWQGYTCLQLAVNTGMLELVDTLLKAGANVNQPGRKDSTPLQAAIENSNRTMTEYLLKAGAGVNQRDDAGYSPLEYAVNLNEWKTSLYMLTLLITHGARAEDSTREIIPGQIVFDHLSLLTAILENYIDSTPKSEGVNEYMRYIKEYVLKIKEAFTKVMDSTADDANESDDPFLTLCKAAEQVAQATEDDSEFRAGFRSLLPKLQ